MVITDKFVYNFKGKSNQRKIDNKKISGISFSTKK